MPGEFSDRHLEMADELRAWLADTLPPAAEVDRSYAPDELGNEFTGKLVQLFPTTEEDVQRLTRRRMMTEYGFDILTQERYTPAALSDPGETVPPEWTDDRCGWVKERVYTPLNDAVKKRDRIIPMAFPQTCRIEVKYDPERLKGKVFWSVVSIKMREERDES